GPGIDEAGLDPGQGGGRGVEGHAVVPAMGAVKIEDRSAALVEAAGEQHAAADGVVAEDVAERRREAAADVAAEAVHADADDGLTDEVDRQLRLVRRRG